MRTLVVLLVIVASFFLGVAVAGWQVSEAFKTPEGVELCRQLLAGAR